MNSVGGFREGEIDGKPFLIFTLLSQTDTPTSSSSSSSSGEAAIDSGGLDLPLFLCPSLRIKVHELKLEENGYSRIEFLPLDVSPHFPSTRSDDQQVQYLLDSDSHYYICKLPLFPLVWCNNKGSDDDDDSFCCGACLSSKLSTNYYLCVTCGEMFHKECVESPLEIKHLSHPFHSLQLYHFPYGSLECISCETDLYKLIYHCPTYNLSMHPVCAMNPIPLVIDHPKRHPHPLTFFPKQAFLPCNVCGMIEQLIPTYVCAPCSYVVHRDCVYFPYVIRISRHQHRISFISSLPSGKWFCGVCRQKVDNSYGAYTCNMCNDYFVHSRCALRRDVWDGTELKGVHERLDDIAVEPYEVMDETMIFHFSHGHNLKLETSRVYNESKFCQACVLPIYEGDYFTCMDQCDFFLHETCAKAPRKKRHMLHPHPLTLKVVSNGFDNKGHFCCDACQRESCGFVYECPTRECDFRLDVRCASISEPFDYQGHGHPLFLSLKHEREKSAICQICQEDGDGDNHCRKLSCVKCDYIVCFKCATLPYRARYEDDTHFLTFRKGSKASGHLDWCDVCERKILDSTKEGFYSCDDCSDTLHINCLIGEDPYMKPGQTIIYHGMELHVLPNDTTMFRPFCHCCEQHCPHRVVFQKNKEAFCSLGCVLNFGG